MVTGALDAHHVLIHAVPRLSHLGIEVAVHGGDHVVGGELSAIVELHPWRISYTQVVGSGFENDSASPGLSVKSAFSRSSDSHIFASTWLSA